MIAARLRYGLAWAATVATLLFGVAGALWIALAPLINFLLLGAIAALLLRYAGCR